MTSKNALVRGLNRGIVLATLVSAITFCTVRQAYAAGTYDDTATSPDVTGTWVGSLVPKHRSVSPFTITIVVRKGENGALAATGSLDSNCIKHVALHVTVNGSNVVFAGSDKDGNSITVRGTVDDTGTLLKSTYILNGSASGRCETDNGSGDLIKQ
jgi:hypothetical protein